MADRPAGVAKNGSAPPVDESVKGTLSGTPIYDAVVQKHGRPPKGYRPKSAAEMLEAAAEKVGKEKGKHGRGTSPVRRRADSDG